MIDQFRQNGVSFLRPYGTAPIKPETEIDISHEALIRCWQQIADKKDGWLQREFEDGLIWKSLLIQARKVRDTLGRGPQMIAGCVASTATIGRLVQAV